VICLHHHGIRWQLEPDFAPQLERVLADPGRVIKKSPAKLVTLHQLPNGGYYLKRYRNDVTPLRPLKFFFKPSHSRREWRLAREFERRDIPVVRHLAYGERWSWNGLRESTLITEAFEGRPLLECPDQQSPRIQSALGRLVRRMHDRGVVQFDLAQNVLLRTEPFELRRVDVHHATIKDVLDQSDRLENLAFIHVMLPLTHDFFAAYGWSRELAETTWAHSEESRRQFYRTRAFRCLHRNAEFESRKLGALRWQVRRPLINSKMEEILRAPDAILANGSQLLKTSRATTVGLVEGVVVKRYNLRTRKLQNLAKDLFRRSKARRAFRKAYHLELAGIPTARPIAVADRRWARVLLRCYLVMEAISGATELGQWRGDPAHALRCAAELVVRLHNAGFFHRDLKETNLVFDRENRLFLIDLEGLEYCGTVSRERAALDLARFARSAETLPQLRKLYRAQFLERYCQLRGLKLSEVAGETARD